MRKMRLSAAVTGASLRAEAGFAESAPAGVGEDFFAEGKN
jgi:hypothetical protein